MYKRFLHLFLSVLMLLGSISPVLSQPVNTGLQGFVNGMRVTLSSTDPCPTSAQSGTTLYMVPGTPNGGGHPYITLRTSAGNYELIKKMGTVSVSVGTNYFRVGNVYAYRTSSGKLSLEIDWWDSGGQSSQTITNATAANPVVLTTSSSHGWSVGDRVGVRNITGTVGTDSSRGINNHQFYVSAVTSTTVTLEGADGSSLAYTSGGSVYKVPASATTGQTLTDGLLLKTGDLTRRLVATFQTDGAGNVLDGQTTGRNLSNVDNQEIVEVYAQDPADSHTYNSSTWRKFNALMVTGQTRLYWTVATPRAVSIMLSSHAVLGNNYNGFAATKNRDNHGAAANLTGGAAASVPVFMYGYYVTNNLKEWIETETASTNWLQLWECVGSGTGTFYGDQGFGVPSSDGTYIRVVLPR